MNLGCAGTDSACRGNSRKRIRGNEKKTRIRGGWLVIGSSISGGEV